MKRINRRVVVLAIAIVTVAVTGGAYAAPQSSSKADGKRTIQLREASAQPALTVVDVGMAGPTPGDHVVTTDGLLDETGAAAGSMEQVCTLLAPAPNILAGTFDCTGSFTLAGGTVTVQGTFAPSVPLNTLAITGGTGDYVKARGEVAIAAEADTITVALA